MIAISMEWALLAGAAAVVVSAVAASCIVMALGMGTFHLYRRATMKVGFKKGRRADE